MTKEKFIELADIMCDLSASEWNLNKSHGIDIVGLSSKYNTAFDIFGESYFGKDRWWELMDYLFNPDLENKPESISEFFDKWNNNGTATYNNIQFNY